jgi:hypothetical protein
MLIQNIAGLFCRPTFRALAGESRPASLIQELSRIKTPRSLKLRDLFEFCYTKLSVDYRAEYLYKNEIASRLVFGKHSPRTTSFQTEFRVGKSVADAVMFNGTSTAFEIKTELDNLKRLTPQLADYRRVFDRIYIVVPASGVGAVIEQTESPVGVLSLGSRGSLSVAREAKSNLGSVSPDAIFNSLRRSEYLEVLKQYLDWEPSCSAAHTYLAAKEAFQLLSPEDAHEGALTQWRQRTTEESAVEFLRSLPASLRTLGLSEPLSAVGRRRLLERLNSRVDTL